MHVNLNAVDLAHSHVLTVVVVDVKMIALNSVNHVLDVQVVAKPRVRMIVKLNARSHALMAASLNVSRNVIPHVARLNARIHVTHVVQVDVVEVHVIKNVVNNAN